MFLSFKISVYSRFKKKNHLRGVLGFPSGSESKETTCGAGPRFNPWVRKIPWRRKWRLTEVLLPGEFQGQKSLAGYSWWSHKELHKTERLTLLLFLRQTFLNIVVVYISFLVKAMATHSSTLAWKIPWMEEPGRLQSMGLWRVRHDWATSLSLFTFMHGEGNGNPLQYPCLENPRDDGAWWAAIYGVAQSRIQLKRLSSSSIL